MSRTARSISRLSEIRSVVVIGSSGCGKTTLVSGVRTPPYSNDMVVPRRLVTRSEREDEDSRENRHIARDEFRALVAAGRVDPCWSRLLERGREEHYGFESIDIADARLRVYSANNGFARSRHRSVLRVLRNSLVVVVTSRREARKARLAEKDMPQPERAVRLADDAHDILRAERLVRVIDTSELTPLEGQRAFQEVIDRILVVQGAREKQFAA